MSNRTVYYDNEKVYSKCKRRFYIVWKWDFSDSRYLIDHIHFRRDKFKEIDNLKEVFFRLSKADKKNIEVMVERLRALNLNV